MKIGDVVKLLRSEDIHLGTGHLDRHYGHHGIVTRIDNSHGEVWADVLFADGLSECWEAHLEVISESLTDEQLENVRGGMSHQTFSDWRARKINESR